MSVKVIRYDESLPNYGLNALPKRKDFHDPEATKYVHDRIDAKEPIVFMPICEEERSEYLKTGPRGGMTTRFFIFGSLLNGAKSCVILNNIPIYFDITSIKEDSSKHIFRDQISMMGLKNSIQDILRDSDLLTKVTKFEEVDLRPLMCFQPKKSKYLRLYFNCLSDRDKAIKIIRKHNTTTTGAKKYELISDDECSWTSVTNYFRMIARVNKFNTCSWNVLTCYNMLDADALSPIC